MRRILTALELAAYRELAEAAKKLRRAQRNATAKAKTPAKGEGAARG